MTKNKHLLDPKKAMEFIAAGKAKFTLVGKENRFTYYVMQPKFNKKPAENMRFVKVMDSKRSNDLTYIGLLKFDGKRWNFDFRIPTSLPSEFASFTRESLEVKAFKKAIEIYQHPECANTPMEIWHEGSCCCCARPLTVPESIVLGWGQVCLKRLRAKLLEGKETHEEFLAR